MTTLTIKVPEKAKEKLSAIVKELGGVIISTSKKTSISKKNKLVSEIKAGLREVKDIRDGKSTSYNMSDLFDGK